MRDLTSTLMMNALSALDDEIPCTVDLIVGGGGAMVLAYKFPLATTDIDAVAKGLSADELKVFIKKVADKLDLPADWLNPWFSSFTYVLPADYESRLVEIFKGRRLMAKALGKEDLLLMKCFAHRKKDVAHARVLVRAGADTEMVYTRIEELAKKKIPKCTEARDFLEEIIDLEAI